MTEPKMASLTLHASANGDGLDGINMEVRFSGADGEYDPTALIDIVINRLANQLIENSELARAASAAEATKPSLILVPGGQ